MTEIIFHAYPQSPIAEKARLAFGLKNLSWQAVEIPRLPPKPLLIELTGGYRRTPVMQIGADIYCDSQCIARELERRFPEPTFFPGTTSALAWCFSRWTDDPLFDTAVKIVLGSGGDALPKDFAKDRGRLYFGPNWAENLKAANSDLPHLTSQLRAQLSWVNSHLADNRTYLFGDTPGLADLLVYAPVWFVRGRWEQGPSLLSEFHALNMWEDRIAKIGHGISQPLEAEDAITIAANAEPATPEQTDPHDTLGLKPGDNVAIHIDVDGGEEPIVGKIRTISADTVSIMRTGARVGTLCVHFPRTGIRIVPN